MMRSKQLAEAIRLADPANGGLDGQDPMLGVAASVSRTRERVQRLTLRRLNRPKP